MRRLGAVTTQSAKNPVTLCVGMHGLSPDRTHTGVAVGGGWGGRRRSPVSRRLRNLERCITSSRVAPTVCKPAVRRVEHSTTLTDGYQMVYIHRLWVRILQRLVNGLAAQVAVGMGSGGQQVSSEHLPTMGLQWCALSCHWCPPGVGWVGWVGQSHPVTAKAPGANAHDA